MTDPAMPMPRPGTESHGPRSAAACTPVPLMDPRRVYDAWGPQAEEAVLRILRTHAYVKGPEVAGLEAEFAAHTGVRRAVAVDSGTDALTLVLRAVLDRRPPDQREVILPTFTFVATAGAVVNAGGVPVFADVLPETMNIDPASVAERLTPRTAAVVPVHLFGSPADMRALGEVVAGGDLFVLEDAAQAVHADLGERRAGALGDAGAFSFYPSKNLGGAGDGGMVTTDDARLADTVAALRDHGQTRKLYDHGMVGTNSRMDEIQAAVLRTKLPLIESWTSQRRAVAARYDLAFQGTDVRPQHILADAVSAYHLYTVRVEQRDRLREGLQERGISTGIYYPVPLHAQSCFAAWSPAPCPVADGLSAEVLSLPCFPGLERSEQDTVIDVVREIVLD